VPLFEVHLLCDVTSEVDALFPPAVFYFLKLSDEEAESRRCWLDQYLMRVSQSLYINTRLVRLFAGM
jgi:hypothetical protein